MSLTLKWKSKCWLYQQKASENIQLFKGLRRTFFQAFHVLHVECLLYFVCIVKHYISNIQKNEMLKEKDKQQVIKEVISRKTIMQRKSLILISIWWPKARASVALLFLSSCPKKLSMIMNWYKYWNRLFWIFWLQSQNSTSSGSNSF